MLVLVPNDEVEFFAQFCQKIGYKTEQIQNFKNESPYASDEECDKAIEAVMQGLKQPKSRAVFERLKDK